MTRFETVTCSRCGGCGKYSYCQMYGDTCFKCQGTGNSYTKRGAEAKRWFNERLSKKASELTVGEKIWVDVYFKRGWSVVTSISPDETLYNGAIRTDYLHIQTEIGGQYISGDTLIRAAHNSEQKQAIMAEALAYQESLTKMGTVRKSRTAEAVCA